VPTTYIQSRLACLAAHVLSVGAWGDNGGSSCVCVLIIIQNVVVVVVSLARPFFIGEQQSSASIMLIDDIIMRQQEEEDRGGDGERVVVVVVVVVGGVCVCSTAQHSTAPSNPAPLEPSQSTRIDQWSIDSSRFDCDFAGPIDRNNHKGALASWFDGLADVRSEKPRTRSSSVTRHSSRGVERRARGGGASTPSLVADGEKQRVCRRFTSR
jgi:hypothetical protein